MSVSGSSAWLESRIERALLWFQRIILFVLLVFALLRGGFLEALAVAAILIIHGAVYWAASRMKPVAWRQWAITLVDLVLGGLAFYLTGNVVGQAGILGFCLAGIMAARLSLWWALAVNVVLWFLFTLPFIYFWLWLGEPFPLQIAGNLIIYSALTFTTNCLVSMEARQARIGRDASLRLRQLTTLHEVGQAVSSTLDLDSVLNLVMSKAVEILNAEAGSLLLLDDIGAGESGELVFRAASGPAADSLIGRRLPPGEGIAGAVLSAGEGQFVNDVQGDLRWCSAPDIATSFEIRSILCVPLVSRGRTVGVLEVINKRDRPPFDDNDLQFLSTFAAQAAIAVENASLYERTDEALNKRLRELVTIEEIDHELGTNRDYDQVLNVVLRRAIGACGASSGAIGILMPDGQRLDVQFWHTEQPDTVPVPTITEWSVERGVVGRVVRTGQPALVADVTTDPDYEELVPTTRSEVAVPIEREGCVIGVLNLESDQPAAFTRHDLHFIEHLAHHAGIAIENTRLFQKERQRVQMLSAISEISQEIRASLDLERTLNLILARVRGLVDYYIAEICLWNEAERLMVTWASAGDARYTARTGGIYRLNEGFTGWIARHQERLFVPDIAVRQDVRPKIIAEDTPVRSYMGIPLKTGETFVGTLELASDQRGFYTEDKLEILQIFADQAAAAIQNARLYEETQRLYAQTDERLQARVDELVALQRTMQELNATLALGRILQVVLGSAVQTTGATHGNVMLMDVDSGALTLRIAEGYSAKEQAIIEGMLLHPSGDSITRQVAASGQARIVDDAVRESCIVRVRSDTRSALVVPIFYQDAVVGLINLRHTEVEAFDQEDMIFVQTLAEQAAIAIGNALRYEDQVRANTALRRRTEQMDGLLHVSQKLRADVPLEEILEEVAYAIQETVGFNIVLISIVEEWPSATPMLCRVAAAGLPLDVFEEAKQVRQPLERYNQILREEYREGACYFFPFQRRQDWEAQLHTIVPMPEIEEWEEGQWHPHDMLLAPLRGAGGRLLGHISVDEPRDGCRPSRQTLETLTIFANQAAIAVENANLYADAKRRADNLSLINEVGRALTHALEPKQVLDVVVKGVGLLLQCEMSAVFQRDSLDSKFAAVASYGIDPADIAGLCFAPGEDLVGQVAASGISLVISDTDQDPRFGEGPVPVGSMMLVPIVVGRQVIGVLAAGSPRKYALTESDRVLLTTLADRAAVALENARLFTGTQQAAERLSLLNEIGRRAAARLELEEMLKTTVQALHQHLGFFRVAVFLVDEGARELYVAAADGGFWPVIPSEYRQGVGEGLVGAAAATGNTILANDAWADERFFRVGEWGAPSSLSVPIKVAGKVIGVLEAEADQPGAFTEEDAAALEMSADQLAVAIQNARLFEETQRRVAELATINQIGRAISGALDTDQLEELIYSQVSNLLDTQNFQISLYDPATQLIHIQFIVENGQRQPPICLKLGQGLVSYLVRSGQSLLLTHGTDEFLQEHGLREQGNQAKSWLGVPMMAEDRVTGTIAVQSYDQENAFDQGHLDLLSTIAGQAAVAFQNAGLFQERQQRIEQLAIVNEVARAVSSTLELDDLLETVYQQVSRFLDTTNFYIALYNEEKDEVSFPFVVDPDRREDWSPREGEEGLIGRIVETGKPLLLPSGAAGLCRSWLGVPMIAEDKVLGVIVVQSYEQEHVYNEEHLSLLSTVAAQAAVAVRNAQLYQQIVHFSSELEEIVKAHTCDLEKALDELTLERDRAETLYRITSELGTTLDLERVLQRALQLFADALGIEHGTITLLDQESGYLDLKATLDKDQELPRTREGWRTPLRQGVGLAGWVLENREPVLVPDVTQDPRWIELDGREINVRSVVAAPLSLGGGDILGVLTLGHPKRGYFTKEHLQLVTAAAAQVAIAVNNSDLYAFITDQADQLGSMLQAQQAEAAKNQAVLESIADGVLVLDHNGRVLLVNPAAEEMLGIAAMVLEGEHFRHMLGLGETPIHRGLAQLLYTELRNRLEATEAAEGETRLQAGGVRLEWGERVLAVNIAPLVATIAGPPGLVAALRDISREAEVERLKNEFVSTVSHELRTPMTSIKGYTDLLFLGMAGGLTNAQRSFLQIIKSNADRLTALVNDILDISRVETGRLRLTIEPLNLGEITTQVVAVFQEQYWEKGLGLEWKDPGDLPQVRGDAARVTQVLNNLLANAWQYTLSGGHVVVSVRALDSFLQVDVVDTGIGIASDDIDRIFDRFYQANQPIVQEVGGTGLGLSIVKMFVEMLGGEIWVESELGVGSTFSFTLPLATAEVPEVSPDLLTTELPMLVSRRPKILVVEDDHDLALLLRRQLESEGYQVVLAGSGEDALWLAKEEQPQLITLDMMLPDMDGFAVLEQLQDHPVTAPIPVVITSVLDKAEQGYALGAVDYVVKPFSEEKLVEAVRRALSPLGEGMTYNVLVVDDDPDILSLMEKALSFHGYQVSTASGGREALAQVQESLPDLILLDLRMPDVDGYEVIRRLKGNDATHSIPIIVITASSVDKEQDKVRVLGMGAAQYITKPLSIEMLIREIKKAIVERQPA